MFGDPTYADAVLDRLVHNAHRIDLNGESMRRTRKPSRTARANGVVDMPLRLDNARALPTCPQQQTKKTFKPRFKVDHAASPMPETRQPERLAPRATSNRNGGRDHLGILGEIKSVDPGEIIGIRILVQVANAGGRPPRLRNLPDQK